MKIFISHSEKNSEIVLMFAELLEMLSGDIEVFCTSERGSINVGKNYIKDIFNELDTCDVFLPIISQEYYKSKFCMIELGVAYSYFYNKYEKNGEEYIFPFAIYPMLKSQILSGTPMNYIQCGDLNDDTDIRGFLEYLSFEKGVVLRSGVNRKIHSFKLEIDRILLAKQNIMHMAKIDTYFDDSIDYKHKEDIVRSSLSKEGITVNYNMNPYEEKDVKKPNFISVVLGYVDKINLKRYLDYNEVAEFNFFLTNFTNSLERIYVEFKYSDNNRILKTFEIKLDHGENKLSIPLFEMRSIALENISEVCFVIHPDDVNEDEGMFKISQIGID